MVKKVLNALVAIDMATKLNQTVYKKNLHIKLPKRSGYAKYFDETKDMNFVKRENY